ncbi:hypothetical protein ACOMHN_035113 [Nucella lapillus]
MYIVKSHRFLGSSNQNTDDTGGGADDESSSDQSDEEVQKRYQLLRKSASGSTITRSLPRSGSDRSTTTIASRTTVATVTAAPASGTSPAGPTNAAAAVSAATVTTAAGASKLSLVHGLKARAERTEGRRSPDRSSVKEQKQLLEKHIAPTGESNKPPSATYSEVSETRQPGKDSPIGLRRPDKTNIPNAQDLTSPDIPDSQPRQELESHGPSIKHSLGFESRGDVTNHQSHQELESRDNLTNQSPQAFGSRDIPVSHSPQGLGSRGSVGSQSSQRQKAYPSPPQLDPSPQVGDGVAAVPADAEECAASDYAKSVNGQVGSVTCAENQALHSEMPETASLASFSASEQALIPGNDGERRRRKGGNRIRTDKE